MTRRLVIPKVRCGAHSKRTQERCRKWAVPGTTVCHKHGGNAEQVVRKAMERQTLATLMQQDARHPWEVVLDATHVADSLMREAKLALDSGQPLTPDQLARLVESTKLAHHMARTAIDSRAHEHLATQVERQEAFEGKIVGDALGHVVQALAAGLGLDQHRRRQLTTWAIKAAQAVLDVIDEKNAEPDLPPWPLHDVTFVVYERPEHPERPALPAAQMSSTASWMPTGTDAPATGDGTPQDDDGTRQDASDAATAPDVPNAPVDAEIVDDEPKPTTWSPGGLPNAWGRGEGGPMSRRLFE